MTPKEIKRKIKELKKMKKGITVKCQARRDINKQIRELKGKLLYDVSPKKQEIINQIEKLKTHVVDLRKFTVEELTKHLQILRRK